jgi:hypothetical protein
MIEFVLDAATSVLLHCITIVITVAVVFIALLFFDDVVNNVVVMNANHAFAGIQKVSRFALIKISRTNASARVTIV